MPGRLCRKILPVSIAAVALAGLAPAAHAQTMIEHSSEARFQLDVHVPDAVLNAYLPPGWTPNVAAQGAAKDCNLRVIFIDRVSINGPDGKPAGSCRTALVRPRDPRSGRR